MDTMLPVILIGRRALAIIGIAKRSQRFEVQAVEELNEAQMRLLLGSGALVVREVEELDPLHSDPMMCELEILIKEAFTT